MKNDNEINEIQNILKKIPREDNSNCDKSFKIIVKGNSGN